MVTLSRAASRLLLVLVLCLTGIGPIAAFTELRPGDPRPAEPDLARTGAIVRGPAWMDRNGNRVDDRLEQQYRREGRAGPQAPGEPPAADVMLCLDHAPTAADLARLRARGAVVVEAWGDMVYAVRARFPAARMPPAALELLGGEPGVTWVEENALLHAAGYYANRQTRARTAWAAGWEGSPSHSLVVMDTGLDATHPDLSGRIAAWADFVGADVISLGDEYPAPTDKNGHGTAIASLAAGDGSAAGISSGSGVLPLSTPIPVSTPTLVVAQSTRVFPIDTTGADSGGRLTARLRWQATLPRSIHTLRLMGDAAGGSLPLGGARVAAGAAQPFELTVDSLPSGLRSFLFQATVSTSADHPGGILVPLSAWLQLRTPMSPAGDGRPLMRGVAPGCRLVGVKVLDDLARSSTATMLSAMAWINANRLALNIVCVNGSLESTSVSALIDTVVNQIVRAGVVWVNAAGNSRETLRDREQAGQPAGIFSPSSAARAIAVAATNELDSITNFSSYGRDGQRKPDLAAPGGSLFTGRSLATADTNGADDEGVQALKVEDQFPNDYRFMQGTSFAAPQVAGAVMLVAQAMGTWTFTEAQALRVKSLLLMTATETGLRAEPMARDPNGQSLPLPPEPVLSRGDKDRAEGFGRLNVDAAVEAVSRSLTLGTPESAALGPGPLDRKAWARHVTLAAGTTYSFTLANAPGADDDLYLYAETPVTVGDSEGEPRLEASGRRAALGGVETVSFTPSTAGRYYVVVKHVAGSGAFQVSAAAAADFAIEVSPGAQRLEAKGERLRYQVGVTALSGFTGAVDLSIAGALPAGVTAQLQPATLNPGETATLTLTTSGATPDGALSFTVQGAARSVVRIAEARLEVGAIWPRFHHDGRGSGRSPFNGPRSAGLAWLHNLGAPSASSPAIAGDGTIYLGTRGGRLRAVRASDGATLWTFTLPSGGAVDGSPAVGIDGTLYIGADDGRLYALRSDGALRWQLSLGSVQVNSGPAIAPDGTLYVTAGGALHAVRPDGTRKWTFTGAGSGGGSPALGGDGTIYFGSGSRLYAVRDGGSEGTARWEFKTTGEIVASPAIAPNGRLYCGTTGDETGGRFYVLTDGEASATKVAEVTTSGAVRSSPAVAADGSAYVGDDGNTLHAFSADGARKWMATESAAIVSSPVLGGDGLVYYAARDGMVRARRDEGSTSSLVWSFATGAEVQATPAIGANGALYLPTLNGTLYAFLEGAAPTFAVSLSPPAPAPVVVGGTLSYTLQIQALNGFTGTVMLEAVGLPLGITPTFEPATVTLGASGTGQSVLRLATSSAASAGEFRFRVRATAGTILRETNTVAGTLYDFSLIGQPDVQRVTAGNPALFSVIPYPSSLIPAFSGAIGLSAVIVAGPTGGTPPALTFDSTSLTSYTMATLTARTTPDTLPGAYTLEIRGTSGALVRTATFRLEVAGFEVTAAPASRTVERGGSAAFTVNVASVFGFNLPVTLTAPGTLPAGVTLTFSPTSVTGTGATTGTVATTAATPLGTHTLTLTGTAGGITRTAAVTLTVTAPAGGGT